jgi:hypothetical protein
VARSKEPDADAPPVLVELRPWLRLFLWYLAWFLPGLGYVFALLVSPAMRSWGRVSIVLLYIAMVVLGILLREGLTGRPRRVSLAAGAILVAVTASQAAVDHRPLLAGPLDDLDVDARAYTAALDAVLPAGCPVLQVPLLEFPEGFPLVTPTMGVYDHMWTQVYGPERRWSFGVERNTAAGVAFNGRFPRGQSPAVTVERAAEDGYCAIQLDVWGLDTDQLAQFEALLGAPTVTVGRWRAHGLRPDTGQP